MGSININRNVDDVFYRYKMPRLMAKVEGKGNGIKTVIANMSEIAKALNRPPTYPTKYFGCELGAQTQFDFKNERFIVNGEHDAQKLQDLLDGFIKRFVLCTECENPETSLTVSKQQIAQKCKACGFSGTIDPKLRLSTFILKNPPTEDGTGTVNAAALQAEKNRKARKGGKGAAKDKGSPTSETKDEDGSDEFDAPTNGHENGSDEGDWGDDVDGGAEVDKLRLTGAMAGLTMNEDLEKSVSERLDMFYKYLEQEKNEGALDGKKLLNEAKRLDIKEKAVLLLCRVLLEKDVVSEIKPNRMILLMFCHSDQKAQKYLIGGIEQLIEQRKDELLPKTARILKEFYDNDILDEEVLVEWGEKVSKKYVGKDMSKKIHEKADPFIKWLREAEEESEEDENEVEVAFDAGTVKPQLQSVKQANAGAQMNGKSHATGDDDELDIDDI